MSSIAKSTTLSWYHKLCIKILKAGPIPKHIAFIMDGNRRYAVKENVPTLVGHSKGSEVILKMGLWCQKLGIRECTVYAFSIENFKRSQKEVHDLMKLACEYYEKLFEEMDKVHSQGFCIRIIGNFTLIPDALRSRMAKIMLLTKDNDKIFINFAFAYTSRDEITNSFQVIGDGVRKNEILVDDINEYLIYKCMHSGKSAEPDILIRTSGEVRFSDFFLWQSWNTNIMFIKVLWPDFSIWHFFTIVFSYQRYYADQQRVTERLRYDNSDNVVCERVRAFIENVENRRMAQMEIYAKSA